MASAYPLFFQYTDEVGGIGPAVRVLSWRTDLEKAFTSCISGLADESGGWASMAKVVPKMQEELPGFSSNDYGFRNLKYLMMEILGDRMQCKYSANNTMLRVRIKVPVDYEGMTVKQLTGISRERGLSGYSKLRKADLIELIRANESD